ncbi:hypothetical protein [Desulfomonile tiedjei]|uniref:Glycosyltransferase RgtA/B/C/D-like domain-containing protein n=1 Tax=Desulfomonile tiedjei (strain ATCC 49306 / DSM 6799 / DCB-1) TaxID=706587 RepID=I4C4D1_DESTA|nr:hypothetical protein [Desulfomonile tiedjei]AFM24422.1 hypothetical protein Desti_1712 [Desulfomonile tiedjei DSM 6799]
MTDFQVPGKIHTIIDRIPLAALIGFLFCVFVSALPELAPIMRPVDGHVWTPVNSQRFRSGDTYQYGALVMGAVKGNLLSGSPTAKEKSQRGSIELLKVVSTALAAVPSWIASDRRVSIVISRCIFPGIIFLLCYLLLRLFLDNPRVCVFAALYVLFYLPSWYIFTSSPEIMKPLKVFLGYWAVILTVNEYDYSTNFRFLVTSVSSCVFLATMWSFVTLERRQTWWAFFLALILSVALAFNYPPQTIVGYLILAGLTAMFFLEKEPRKGFEFFGLGLSILAALALMNYPNLVLSYSSDTNSFGSIWNISFSELREGATFFDALFLFVKYALIIAVSLYAAGSNRELRRWLIVLGSIGLVFVILDLFASNSLVSYRLLYRAHSLVWLCFVAAAFIGWLSRSSEQWIGSALWKNRLKRAVSVLSILLVIVVPLVGFSQFAWKNLQDSSHYLEDGQYGAYQWLRENSPKGSVVLAMDWDDVNLIPMYTDNYLFFGHLIVDNRSPAEEVARYLKAWNMLGLPDSRLKRLVNESVAHASDLIRYWPLYGMSRPQSFDRVAFESAMFVYGLVYWPFIGSLDGVPLAEKDGRRVDFDFVKKVIGWYDGRIWRTLGQTECDYILVSDLYWGEAGNLRENPHLKLVYQSSCRKIFQVISPRVIPECE